MYLRDLVGKWFIEYRTELFNMEVGRLGYDLLNTDAGMTIPNKVADMNKMQILVVLRCIVSGIDYTPIISKNFNHKQMEELRQYLLRGMDIEIVNDERIDHTVMNLVRNTITKGIVIPDIEFTNFSTEQLEQIFSAVSFGLDITPLLNPEMSEDEMESLRKEMMQIKLSEKCRMDSEYYKNIHNRIFESK